MSEEFKSSKFKVLSVMLLLVVVFVILFFIPVEPVTLIQGIDYEDPTFLLNILIMFIFIVVIPIVILYGYYMIRTGKREKYSKK